MPRLRARSKARLRRNYFFALVLLAAPVGAKDRTPVPDNALDGGILSAEALGRGNTIAANPGSPADGSQNPAGLIDSSLNSTYATALVHTSTNLDSDIAQASDPLAGKVLQYFSMQGDKGVIFFEPLSRMRSQQVTNTASPTTDFRDVEYDADAFGFAGAERFGPGSIGLSIAYLHSSIAVTEHSAGIADKFNYDTADGLRLNLGVRYPTGPATWGATLQNAPGMLWGKDYDRNILPVKFRVGNTVKLSKEILLSLDWERRYYHEGSNADSLYYLGLETYVSDYAILRGGYYGSDINKPDKRNATVGMTIVAKTGARINYAMEFSQQDNQSVKRSLVSLQLPFQSSEEDGLSK